MSTPHTPTAGPRNDVCPACNGARHWSGFSCDRCSGTGRVPLRRERWADWKAWTLWNTLPWAVAIVCGMMLGLISDERDAARAEAAALRREVETLRWCERNKIPVVGQNLRWDCEHINGGTP